MSAGHRHGSAECREIFARLSEYLDQDLDPSLCQAMEAHLTDCPPCERFLETLRATVRMLGKTEPTRLPEDLRNEILEGYRRLRAAGGGAAPSESS